MKNYKDMTYRYLKGQKSRTLLTIFGIILSVALITAIGTMIVSVRDALITEVVRDIGSYHGVFYGLDEDTVFKLKNHVDVDKVAIAKEEGHAPVVETTEEERDNYGSNAPYRYLDIKGYDKNAIDLIATNLTEGRLPDNSDEIIIENWMLDYFGEDTSIGDKVKLTLGERHVNYEEDEYGSFIYKDESFEKIREKEYTIVGLTQPGYIYKGEFITSAITALGMKEASSDKYSAYFTIPSLRNAQEKIHSIANDLGIDSDHIQTNHNLLRLSAQGISSGFNAAMVGLLIFIVGLIIVSTIAVIYNAFNISVLERISQFGLLRSVGATPKQIRSIVFKEAGILSLIGIPIGLFSGVFAMKVVLYVISLIKADADLFMDMEAGISGTVFLISSLVGLITVFLSAIGPARQAGRISPLEAIKNTGDIKRESFKKTRTSKITSKILGIEGEIARKNLRRNRKRFWITLFSMTLSIVLFIVFSTFSNFMFKIGDMENAYTGDFEIYSNTNDGYNEAYTKLMDIEGIDRIYKRTSIGSVEILLDEEQISKRLMDMPENRGMFDERKGELIRVPYADITSIGDDNLDVLKGSLESGSIDIDKLNEENGVLVVNNTLVQKSNTVSLLEGYRLKVGDKIPFAINVYDAIDDNIEYGELTVVGVLEKGILDEKYNYNGSINMITTEDVLDKINQNNNPTKDTEELYTTFNIEIEKDADSENISEAIENIVAEIPGLHYIDMAAAAEEERTMAIILSIFLYGFVTVIAIISAINIINTISTNIIIRTREIAMIKAVGMSQAGIKKMVAFESIFYGIYATVIGGLAGAGLTYVLFRILIGVAEFEYQLPWQNVAIACGSAIVIALLSGAYPLRRINEGIIVESMKAEN